MSSEPHPKPQGFLATLARFTSPLLVGGGRSEFVMAAFIVAVVLTMIMPLPTALLDVLIAINISVSAFLIVMALQIKEPLQLTTFPALLLLTTLLRLSLSVASTRLILLDGDAGHIIDAFGSVTVGGNVVVGLVIFLILTVVQFLVITKGSERVAEVGARFALDGMPGKQMAIDMELRNNAISPEVARTRRAAVVQESQFFGSMDGAMKFVKGDAIAGIIILLTNLIAGLAIGITQRNMAAADALRVYSILTIGDGLVAQLPALLTSLTAGLIVTRVATSAVTGPTSIGAEIIDQFRSVPRAWIAAGGAILVFGLIPGMPFPVFALLAALSTGVGVYLMRLSLRLEKGSAKKDSGMIDNADDFGIVEHYELRTHTGERGRETVAAAINVARDVRNQLIDRYGMFLPPIKIKFDDVTPPGEFEFLCDESFMFGGFFNDTRSVVHCSLDRLTNAGITPSASSRVELSTRVRHWIDEAEVDAAKAAGIEVSSASTLYRSQMRTILLRTGYRFVGIQETHKIIGYVAARFPDLAKELDRVLPPSRMAEVLQRLVAERISIRNFRLVIETLVEWAQRERDAVLLTECVRAALRRQICEEFGVGDSINAYLLKPDTETLIRDSVRQTSYGSFVTLGWEQTQDFVSQIERLLEGRDLTQSEPVVLTAQDIRPHVRKMLEDHFFELPVLSFNEILPEYRIQPIGVVELGMDDDMLDEMEE